MLLAGCCNLFDKIIKITKIHSVFRYLHNLGTISLSFTVYMQAYDMCIMYVNDVKCE